MPRAVGILSVNILSSAELALRVLMLQATVPPARDQNLETSVLCSGFGNCYVGLISLILPTHLSE
jgi:hypothetical protein